MFNFLSTDDKESDLSKNFQNECEGDFLFSTRQFGGLCLLVGLAFLTLFVGCSDKKPLNSEAATGVRVQVTVNSYVCEPNIYGPERRYAILQGGTATVSFYGWNGQSYVETTDEESIARLSVDTGLYGIKVETEHGYPTFFDSVYVAADTGFSLNVQTLFQEPDTVVVVFQWGQGAGIHYPDGVYRKSVAIFSLNENDFLDCTEIDAWPKDEIVLDGIHYVQYSISKSTHVGLWEAHDLLARLANNTTFIAYAGARGFVKCPGAEYTGEAIPIDLPDKPSH